MYVIYQEGTGSTIVFVYKQQVGDIILSLQGVNNVLITEIIAPAWEWLKETNLFFLSLTMLCELIRLYSVLCVLIILV